MFNPAVIVTCKMIWLNYNPNENEVTFQASGDSFHSAISIFKQNRLQYDPESREWRSSPRRALQVLQEAYENAIPLQAQKEDVESLRKNKYVFGERETISRRAKLKWSLLRYPPIQGKPPYERFQVNTIKRGISQNRLAIFLGMGAGKTYIQTAILNHLFDQGSVDRVLVVAPPEGVVNWKRELLRFATFLDSEKEVCISSAQYQRDFLVECPEAKVVILTYRHFLTESDDYYKAKTGRKSKKYRKPPIPFSHWGTSRVIVLDESHNIKNPQSRTSHVLHLHRSYFNYRYILTGTPTPNDFSEIYSQMKFLDPSLVPKDYYDWLEEVADLGNRFSQYAVNYFRPEKQAEWEQVFSPWVIRRRSADILDLPELYMKPTYVELGKKQIDIYRKIVNMSITYHTAIDGRLIPEKIIDEFPFISQALDNPSLLQGKNPFEGKDVNLEELKKLRKLIDGFRFERDHGKVDVTKSILQNHISSGAKVVLFDFHPLTLNQLGEVFKSYNPIIIHGQGVYGHSSSATSSQDENRDAAIEEFKHDPSRKLLIASSRVMKTSINLQAATVALYFSRDYSYLNWSQSLGRLHRIGQDEPVHIYPLIFDKSLDRALHYSLSQKEDLDAGVFSRKLRNRESLSKEEWKALFNGSIDEDK